MIRFRYRIRAARRKDIQHLPAIERDAAARYRLFGLDELADGPGLPMELLEQRQAQGQVWVALHSNDRPVGFAVVSRLDGYAHLDELDVAIRHGRRGIGTRLVRAVLAWAKRNGLRGVTLSTMRDIPWNAPFYIRLGFEIVADAELTRAQRRLRDLEAMAGLPIRRRVIMRRRFRVRSGQSPRTLPFRGENLP